MVFQVTYLWKGEPADSIVLEQSVSSTCAYRFENGQRYLVYAEREGDLLSAGICSRTAPASQTSEDVVSSFASVCEDRRRRSIRQLPGPFWPVWTRRSGGSVWGGGAPRYLRTVPALVVPALMEQWDQADGGLRLAAFHSLRAFREVAPEAILPLLRKATADTNAAVRAAALEDLIAAAVDPDSLAFLCEAGRRDPDPEGDARGLVRCVQSPVEETKSGRPAGIPAATPRW